MLLYPKCLGKHTVAAEFCHTAWQWITWSATVFHQNLGGHFGYCLLGPYVLPARLTGHNYTAFFWGVGGGTPACVLGRSTIDKRTNDILDPLTPNDPYRGRTAPLTSKHYILYIYSTNICSEYFKHGIYSPFFPLQNAVCFIILTYLVPVLFTFYISIQQI